MTTIKILMIDFDDTIYNFSDAIKQTLFYYCKFYRMTYEQVENMFLSIRKYYEELFAPINVDETLCSDPKIITQFFLRSVFSYPCIFKNEFKKIIGEKVFSEADFWCIFLQFCKPNSQITSLLKTAINKGISIILLSDGLLAHKRRILSHLGLLDFFSQIICSDMISAIKPSKFFFDSALKENAISKKHILYIGNHISDRVMAEKYGVMYLDVNSIDWHGRSIFDV